jgi:hypothetical protein
MTPERKRNLKMKKNTPSQGKTLQSRENAEKRKVGQPESVPANCKTGAKYITYSYITMALGSTQPLTDMSPRNVSWG